MALAHDAAGQQSVVHDTFWRQSVRWLALPLEIR